MPENATNIERKNFLLERCILLISLLLAAFHLYTASFGILPGYMQSSIHWALITTLLFVIRPSKITFGRGLDALFIVITWYITYYLITVQKELVERSGAFTPWEVFLGVLAIVISLEAGRRSLGLILPVLNVLFIGYAMFGQMFPGFLQTANFPVDRIAQRLTSDTPCFQGSIPSFLIVYAASLQDLCKYLGRDRVKSIHLASRHNGRQDTR